MFCCIAGEWFGAHPGEALTLFGLFPFRSRAPNRGITGEMLQELSQQISAIFKH
jgi:hypothetical protein